MRHLTNELSFERPDGLFDRTHHILTVAEDGPSPFTLVVSKNRVEGDETLAAIADRIVVELSRTLIDFKLLSRETALVGGRDAVMLRFRWLQGEQELFQKQAALIHGASDGRFLLQLTATATDAATPEQAAMLDTVLASLEFRDPERR